MQKKSQQSGWTTSNILEEVISCEKHLTTIYNSAANEASSDRVHKDFINILMEEHQLQKDIFTIMQRRGLYAAKIAENTEISQAQQKYNQQHV